MIGTNTPRLFAFGALCVALGSAWGTEYGAVISSTQVVQSVPVPQRVCSDQQVVYPQPTSGAGALIGAIAGAALGSTIGGGMGQVAATGIGMVAGSAVGNQVEANGRPPAAATVQNCRTVTRYENRTVGYDVVYEYQGERRSTRMAQDPGQRIALEVNVAPAGALPSQAVAAAAPPPVVVYEDAPQVVYARPPVYASPYYVNPWPYYPPAVYIGGGWGWGGGRGYYGGWGGRHH